MFVPPDGISFVTSEVSLEIKIFCVFQKRS